MKIDNHTPIPEICFNKNCSPYTFSKRISHKIIIAFYSDNYIPLIAALNLAIKHMKNNDHTYNSFVKVYYFSCPVYCVIISSGFTKIT